MHRWLLFAVGTLQLALGLYQLTTDGSSPWAWGNLVIGIFWFVYGAVVNKRERRSSDGDSGQRP